MSCPLPGGGGGGGVSGELHSDGVAGGQSVGDSSLYMTNALSSAHFLCSGPAPCFLCLATVGGM